MLSENQARECPNFVISSWLFVILLSPLPHSPSYLVDCPANYPVSNRADYSPRYPVRNPAGYLDGYPVSYWAGYLPENLVSYPVGYPDSNSAGYSANCGENRPGRNPESNRGDSWADYSESYWVDSLPDYWEDYSGSFDPKSVCRAAAGARLRSLSKPPPWSGASRDSSLSRSA